LRRISPAGLSVFATLRLGLFQACLGCLAVIFSGLFNRIMITELGFPGLLVGAMLACEQFVAPSRVLFGQISDAHPIAGRHRVPYVLIGATLFSLLAVLAVPLTFRLARLIETGQQHAIGFGMAALCGLYALYGLAISLASTPYLALVIDRTEESERSRAVGIIWAMLTVGIVIGAIATNISLGSLDGIRDPALLQPVLQRFMLGVAAVVWILTCIAVWGMEKPGQANLDRPREDRITLRKAWQLIHFSPQVKIFFVFLVLFTLGVFIQDPVLESYGGMVFGMPIGATAQLNAFWGTGTLLGLLLAGAWIVPRLGKLPAARLGCQLIVVCLGLLLLCGLNPRVVVLKLVLLGFGVAVGIATNAALCLMLDLTLPQVAGTFVGVWGLGQALSRALGKLLGGGFYDLGRLLPLGAGPFGPFALVLSLELLMATLALVVLERVNVRQFREDTQIGLRRVLALDLE
jgi:MFS transporter, BCD family, chlorophyll transporter